jgi:hypothetical protein
MLQHLQEAAKAGSMTLMIKRVSDLFQTELLYFYKKTGIEPLSLFANGTSYQPAAIFPVNTISNWPQN